MSFVPLTIWVPILGVLLLSGRGAGVTGCFDRGQQH